MNCPSCGERQTEVLETRRHLMGTDVERRHRCRCGARWASLQRLVKGSVNTTGRATGSAPVAYPPTTEPPQNTTGSPPVVYGGVGGGLSSGLVPSVSGQGSLPDLSEARSKKIVRVMSPPAYAAEFERFWGESDKLGSKSDAHKAWEQVGNPGADVLLASRAAWLTHWAGIGVKHIATWLRAFDWQQEPAARSALPSTGGLPPARNFRAEANGQAKEGFLRFMNARRTP